VQHPLKVKVM